MIIHDILYSDDADVELRADGEPGGGTQSGHGALRHLNQPVSR